MTFPALFLQASISALIICSIAWLFLRLAQRRWPGIRARRTPWLLAQLAGATTLVLAASPLAARFSVFSVEHTAGIAGLAGDVVAIELARLDADGVAVRSTGDWIYALPWFWLLAYLAGAACLARRLHGHHRALRALLSVAQPLDRQALRAHPGFDPLREPALPVLEVDAPVSPLLAGLVRPQLLLPAHMRTLPPIQQQLIVAHELTHLRRSDQAWQHASALLQVLLWFVPPAHACARSLQWAVELGCDRAVLAGRPDRERRHYAAALVAQLAVQRKAGSDAPGAPAALAFGQQARGAVAERIDLIRHPQPLSGARFASASALLLLPALCGASVLLQPQFMWHHASGTDHQLPQPGSATPGRPSATPWQAPLAQLDVTSEFGAINRPGGKPHGGMDFRASRGTAVYAPAAGTVAVSTDRYQGGERYGKVVVIAHEDGSRTLYAHLDGRTVRAGESVRAGQQIAMSGATGKVSGPHLHFEVSRQGAPIDPQAVLNRAAR